MKILIDKLVEMGLTVATAESCTGGSLAHHFTLEPGSSRYFIGGIVAYHTNVKFKLLEVDENIPIISEECSKQMAFGLNKLLNADICISTTGLLEYDGIVFSTIYYKKKYFNNVFKINTDNRIVTGSEIIEAILRQTYNILCVKL